jgi:hypothetical protein
MVSWFGRIPSFGGTDPSLTLKRAFGTHGFSRSSGGWQTARPGTYLVSATTNAEHSSLMGLGNRRTIGWFSWKGDLFARRKTAESSWRRMEGIFFSCQRANLEVNPDQRKQANLLRTELKVFRQCLRP